MSRVLFVCLGNICRSPIAHALLADRRRGGGDLVDSAGTGDWHLGQPPDPRTLAVLRAHGHAFEHRARQVEPADFERFDRVIAMDASTHAKLVALCPPALRGKLERAFPDRDVPDPWTGTDRDFEAVYQLLAGAVDRWA
jgi:protein-tyrosine phosphatase